MDKLSFMKLNEPSEVLETLQELSEQIQKAKQLFAELDAVKALENREISKWHRTLEELKNKTQQARRKLEV